METKTKQWPDGSIATIQYGGQGDGEIIVTSDSNSEYVARSMQITVETTDGSGLSKTITINQAAKQRIDISAAVVTASNQTYSGSAKTPTPTVTLNGTTIPSSGYDVAYSNNTNAGTATITVTGKGEYTGTATGTFTIAKASRTLSFADTYMVLNTSSTGTKTATPSAGSGDGAITYSIANTTYATINSSTGAVTSKTSDGSATVTASIAEGTNYLSASASYTLYVFATTHDYSYNGSYRSVTLPPGTYQFQCWGAQGGSNAAASSYGIIAKAGGKGGYSIGQLYISQATGVRVYVGGQGSSSSGGYNGGGSTTGSASYDSEDTQGVSRMGGGGGASDIRLSDGALLSRMIVAGGGGGGAMCYKKVTTYTPVTTYEQIANIGCSPFNQVGTWQRWYDGISFNIQVLDSSYPGTTHRLIISPVTFSNLGLQNGDVVRIRTTSNVVLLKCGYIDSMPPDTAYVADGNSVEWTVINNGCNVYIYSNGFYRESVYIEKKVTTQEPSISESNESQVGYAGGGINGVGYSSSYYGKQNAAGSGGSFGQGANQTASNYRYCSGAGGGGWYGGGGGQKSDSSMTYCKYSGGGSGFVNTAASAGNRPSGYTGLELDSGTTYAGNTSFPAPGGGNETGHSGDGHIRITRIS